MKIKGKAIYIAALFSLFFSFGSLKASHLLGGDIVWICDPANPNNYIFTLTLYRDCTGIDLGGGTENISWAGADIICNYVPAESGDVSPNCPRPADKLSCANGDVGAIEKHVWRSGSVSLGGVPPATGLEFSWTSSARPGLVNSTAGVYYLRSIMYPYTPQGAVGALNTNICYDNSPQFQQDANGVTCSGFRFNFNHLASDLDQDSVRFDWAEPYAGAGTPIPWNTGYSYTNPYPNPASNSANGPIYFDQTSGEMSIEAIVADDGWYAGCTVIRSYRCDQLIAEVYRDVAFHFLSDCDINYSSPSARIDTSAYRNIRQNGNIYTTNVYPTDTVEFVITSLDYDTPQQNVTLYAEGMQIPRPRTIPAYGAGTGCIGDTPCVKLTPHLQTGFTNPGSNSFKFFWNPQCVHLATGACGNATNKYYFTLKMQDEACPAPRIGLATVIVNVLSGDPSPPPFKCVEVKKNGDIELKWSEAEIDSALDFNYYRIYSSPVPLTPGVNVSGWTQVAQISNISTTSYTIPNATRPMYFFMVKSTGACDFISEPSEVVTTMDLTLTPVPSNYSKSADLSWTPFATPLPYTSTGVYEVWAETPSGSNNWNKVGETPNTSYTHDVNLCNTSVSFQIRVYDTLANCYSGSNIDSALFSDGINSDKIEIDTVSVNANGNAIISWNTSNSGDIVQYDLMYNDPIQGWIIVANIDTSDTQPYEWVGSQADLRSELFKIISRDSCGNQSDDQITVPVPTVYMRGRINSCEGYYQFSWSSGESFATGLAGYRVYLSSDDGTGPTPYTLVNTYGPRDTSFRRTTFEPGTSYCYKVQAFDSTGTKTSTSNEVCLSGDLRNAVDLQYMATVTTDFEREAIYLRTFIDGEADVPSYLIQRSNDRYGPWQTIAELQPPANPPYVLDFYDYGVEPGNYAYYYRTVADNPCGGIDTVSNLGRNILLNVDPQANMANKLSWTPYIDWENGARSYDVYRKAEEETEYTRIASLIGTDSTHVDNLENLPIIERGNYCYYVVATETPNTLGFVDDNGMAYTSTSNRVCINQKAKMFMPTAFRPDSHIQENQSIGPNMEFDDIDKYTFYVVNRWGTKVFESNDPSLRWNGDFDGSPSPSGVYVFYVKYATPGDDAIEERGTFTLIR